MLTNTSFVDKYQVLMESINEGVNKDAELACFSGISV